MNRQLNGPSMLALVSDLTGPVHWRCLRPFSVLDARGYRCGWDFFDRQGARAQIANYDGLLLARSNWRRFARPIVEAFMLEAHDAGRFVVMDLDDDMLSDGFSERLVGVGMHDGKSIAELEEARAERIWALSQVDGVTVSTETLAEIVRGATDKPVHVVPNAIDLSWFRAALGRRKRQIQGPTIGWAGGVRPDADLASMALGWRWIAARRPEVTFVVQGYLPPIVRQLVPPERIAFFPWLDLERYPEPLVEVDIACCSVAADPFNGCKSLIKAMEAAVAGSAVVASPFLYGALIRDGYDGLLAETPAEWAASLDALIRRPADRAILARRLLRVVEKRHSLAGGVDRWPAAWAAIASDARRRHVRLVRPA